MTAISRFVMLLIAVMPAVTPAVVAAADAGARTERFRFGSEMRELVRLPARHLLVSRECIATGAAPDASTKTVRGDLNTRLPANTGCEARRQLGQASLKLVWKSLGGGVNPGAMICMRLGGQVALGVDAHGNENSFCRFADGSLVSSGTLHYHARINDERP